MKRSDDADDPPVANPKSRIDPPKSAEFTRREWLLKLGEAAVLLGFSDAVEGTTFAVTRPLGPTAPGLSAFPPGVYEPSNDHLSHALSSDSLFHPVPPGSETDYVKPPTEAFRPQFFPADEFATMRRIVELMLGESPELPDASHNAADNHENSSLAVAQWIDLSVCTSADVRDAARSLVADHRALAVAYYGAAAVSKVQTEDRQETFRQGLQWLEDEAQREYHNKFLSLNQIQQIELLKRISDDRPDQATEDPGTKLFHLIKIEVIRGFYTSRAGLRELGYRGNSFYGDFPDCEVHRPSR